MSQDYNKTMNLPQTEFSMRAALPKKEPKMVEEWQTSDQYHKLMEKNAGKPLYVLHDGPPYANGDIHMGTALNKVLKDIIVRSKNMTGFRSPYVPGWDTHGLPIELKALKKVGLGADISPVELRRHCKEFALSYVDSQREQFKRLGSLGDFSDPYLTLKPEFEARQIEIFGEMAKKGYIYKGLKPVHWCPHDVTALAEAEIEYADDPCYSIYVKFLVKDDKGVLTGLGADLSKTYVIIWTTTTWTLPANVAICAGPDFDYSLVKAGEEYYVVATELVESTMKAGHIESYEILGSCKGKDLEYGTCYHPFLDRESMLIVGDHVTLETGTGFVHTAPGHGAEDFDVCVNHYPEIPVIVPVDDHGRMTEEAGFSAGLTTDEANKVIAKHLEESGHLFATMKFTHQYPHCWRCKQPILFRATEQWFCSIDGFKKEAIDAVKQVEWIPGWGEDRMISMIQDRNDWCISRQRNWGVPIPIFYCKQCGAYHIDDSTIKAVADLFRKEGSDGWYLHEASEILPAGTKCPKCGCTEFTKETDIMDVWFDSGVTHAAVLDQRPDLKWPADLYLEGADQYRGWFQSSLLTSVAWRGIAPYKAVCTHGWVVDGEGRKQSKSLGNVNAPSEVIDEYGADILRLWVASSDYHSDVRVSTDIIKQLAEVYRKIRNTARYILGNLYDFNPDTDSVSDDQLTELDRWALDRLNSLTEKVRAAYDRFEFHIVYHAVHNFCTVDMSNFYLDVLKDRLYSEAADSVERRAAQTAIYRILRDLTLLFAPVIPFTSEEIWSYLPLEKGMDKTAPVFNEMPTAHAGESEAFMAKWNRIHALRDDVNKALELARTAKVIGKSLEAKVILSCEGELLDFVGSVKETLPMVFIVSQVEIKEGAEGDFAGDVAGLKVTVAKADGQKCERCWIYSDTVGQCAEHPTLCARCAKVLGK